VERDKKRICGKKTRQGVCMILEIGGGGGGGGGASKNVSLWSELS